MKKPVTETVAGEMEGWAARLEAAPRPQIRELIESLLEEEVEQAVEAENHAYD
jgi:hypothetical protein